MAGEIGAVRYDVGHESHSAMRLNQDFGRCIRFSDQKFTDSISGLVTRFSFAPLQKADHHEEIGRPD